MGWSVDNSISAELAAQEALKQALRAEAGADSVNEAIAESELVSSENVNINVAPVDTIALRNSTYPSPQNGTVVNVLQGASGLAETYRFKTGIGWGLIDKQNATTIGNLTASLAETVKKGEGGSVSWAMADQGFRENVTGGSTAVVGVDAVLKENIVNGQVTREKTDFFITGKNLFDKSKILTDQLLNIATGGTSTSTGYHTSEQFIPIVAGQSYTLKNVRIYAFYTNLKAFINGVNTGNNNATVTVTPVQNGFMKISLFNTNLNTVQVEKGSVATAYEEYKEQIPNMKLTDTQKQSVLELIQDDSLGDLRISKTTGDYSIFSELENGASIEIQTKKNGSTNGSFNFWATFVNGLRVHNTPDDVTPIRTFTTIGGTHGYTVSKITLVGHGKTNADLGSIWTDGTRQYTLLQIIGNVLLFGMQYTVANDIASYTNTLPTANLTHVSGATNTGDIDVTTKASDYLYPSINNVSVKYLLDGKEVTADGNHFGDVLQVVESYHIMDYKSLIDYAQANIGTSFANNAVEGIVKISNTFTFTKGCKCTVASSIKALKKVFLGVSGLLQSVGLDAASHTLKRYMPNVLPKSGVDFKNIHDMSSYSQNNFYYLEDLTDQTKPPNRYVDWLYSGVNKVVGFTMGYIIDKTNSKNSDRLSAQITGGSNKYYWDMRSTKKSYPTAVSSVTLEVGQYLSFMGYRNYIAPTEATNINIVDDAKDTYIYIDYHQSVTGKNIELTKHIGKTVTILDSENFTLLNNVVDSEGVTFNVSNNYGYAVLKVS
jgi:hypothetical protein